ILVGDLLDFNDEKGKMFEIMIQCGAILAVCWEYRAKFIGVLAGLTSQPAARRFVLNLFVAFLPAAILGLLFGKHIKVVLFKPIPVAIAFIVGALVILWAERRDHRVTVQTVDEMRWTDALKVGIAQAFALIPGTSRAGATIIGGMLFGLSRRAATEFSFFLAVPVLFAASAYEFVKNRELFDRHDLGLFGVGFIAAFVSAFFCVRLVSDRIRLDCIGDCLYASGRLDRFLALTTEPRVVLQSANRLPSLGAHARPCRPGIPRARCRLAYNQRQPPPPRLRGSGHRCG